MGCPCGCDNIVCSFCRKNVLSKRVTGSLPIERLYAIYLKNLFSISEEKIGFPCVCGCDIVYSFFREIFSQ